MSAAGHVVLVGLPGSGKSTVAPLLAARLGRGCVDTDAEVESRLRMPVSRVFEELGEPRFRAEERAVVERALASPQPLVVAAGGGLIAQHGAPELLRRHATVVLLDAGDPVLLAAPSRRGPRDEPAPPALGEDGGARPRPAPHSRRLAGPRGGGG